MHGWGKRTLLRHYLERGVSKAELARRFGAVVGRSTGGSDRASRTAICRQARLDTRHGPGVAHKLDPREGVDRGPAR